MEPKFRAAVAVLLLALACTESESGTTPGGMTGTGGSGAMIASGGVGGAAGTIMTGGGAGGLGGAAPLDAGAGSGGGAAMDSGISTGGMPAGDAATTDATMLDAAVDATVDDDRCDVAVYDPAQPPRALAIAGDLGTHDPALIEHEGTVYVWQTGPRLPGKTSTDLLQWSGAPAAFGGSNPGWINGEVPGATDLWAPDVSRFGDRFHLYYSASTFGSNHSCIGHATRQELTSGSWADKGSVVCSDDGDDHNAIDPNVVVDTEGTPWLSFGSFWDGIKAVRLTQEGERADSELHSLASRGGGAIEAPFIVRRCGYYYLFVSFDRCCNGASSTYNIRVGRSADVLGPYTDREGTPMLEGGGTQIVSATQRYRGPGHNAVIFRDSRAYNVFHAYDAENGGRPTLRVAELAWDEDGWPISGGP
jgi:arabinan endo-1,5-alpha-L-arabinosidase